MELLESLTLAKPALSTSDLVPVLQHFCFKDKTVYAYNHYLAIVNKVNVDLNCAVPGNLFLPVLNSLSDKEISVVQDDDSVTVKAGRSKSNFATLPTDDFIFELPQYVDNPSIELSSDFIEGVARCLVSTGEDMNHPEHLGLTFVTIDGSLVLYSTDNKTLSRYHTGYLFNLDKSLVIPKDFCEQLVSIYNRLKGSVELFFDNDYVIADFGDSGTLLFSKVDSFNTIDFENVLNRFDLSSDRFSTLPAGFKEAIDRTLLVQKATNDPRTSLTVKRRSLLIKAENGVGQVEETVSLSIAPDQIGTIYVNPSLVSRVCKFCSTMSIQEKALIFIDEDYTHLITTNTS